MSNPSSFDNRIKAPWLLLLLAGVAFGYALISVLGGPASDEGAHTRQIWNFYIGNSQSEALLTMPPTYHHILAFIVRQAGHYSDSLLRFISMLGSLCLLPVIYCLAARSTPRDAGMRTLQVFFMPLMFPFYFLIYTDMWALVAIALTIYCALQRRFWLAALPASLALALRQDTVIWLGFAFLLTCFDGVHWQDSARYRRIVSNACSRGLPYLALFALFLLFVYFNNGITIGEKDAHRMRLNVTNVYVFLICAWALFLPLNIQNLPQIGTSLRKPWVMLAAVGGLFIYMATYSNPHPYNQANSLFFLHNLLLDVMTHSMLVRGLLYMPVAWMTLTLLSMPWPDKRCYWLLFIIPTSIAIHPMVEPRYYFPAFAFLYVWRPSVSPLADTITLALYLPITAFLMFGTVTGKFFI